MSKFPETVDFMGLNTPLGEEYSLKNLPVEGDIPAEFKGAFFRAVPDPAYPPRFSDDTALSGDGMISRYLFNDDGTVDFDIRFVDTARYRAEREADRAVFGKYRNPYTDEDSVKGVDRTVANTTPVWHAGRLLMTKEDGRAYEVNPHTLETLGSYDFGGALKSETMTAHVRIAPETGEMFLFGYECDGLASTKVSYVIIDKQGKLVREQWFDTPYCSMMHDFAITKNWVIFPVFPTTADLDRIKAGGDHWIHEPELDSWMGVMPRYGDVAEMRWFKGPKGVSSYHMMNAFEDDQGRISMDHHMTATNAFEFIRRASGIDVNVADIFGGLMRWTVDPTSDNTEIEQEMLGPPGDLCRIPDADQGRPYKRGWYLSMNPNATEPPLLGGPVGAMFNALISFEPKTGRISSYNLPPSHGLNEPTHICSNTPGHEGWLITQVDHMTGDGAYEHAAWIFNAGDIEAGPVAKIATPHRLRPQVHGWWASADQLANAKAG